MAKPAADRPAKATKGTFLGLRTVIYPVEDLAKAKAWYAKVLGQAPYFDQPFYVGFNVGGYELGLDPDVAALRRGGNATAYWGVPDCKAAFQAVVAQGAKARAPPNEVGGGIVVATVDDPFGNTLGLIENPGFRLP